MLKQSQVDHSETILEVENLKKHFYTGLGKNKLTIPAVDGVSFSVYKREVFGLVGESGCGKTTTGRTIIKLYNSTQGTVKLNGKTIAAGYADHIKRIYEIKEEARNKILKLDKDKMRIVEIKNSLNDNLSLLNGEIDNLMLDKENEKRNIRSKIQEYNKKKYELNNDFNLDIEKAKYNFLLKKEELVKLTKNTSKLELNKRIKALRSTYKRKLEGLKNSSALNKSEIKKRISLLQKELVNKASSLVDEFSPLIEKNSREIIDKKELKTKIAILKEELKKELETKTKQFRIKSKQLVSPDRKKITNETRLLEKRISIKIKELRFKIKTILKSSNSEIKRISKNKNSSSEKNKSEILKIKNWEKSEIDKEKVLIRDLKRLNNSKESLEYSRKMQMIFQDPISSLNPRMTVLEIIAEGLTIQKKFSKTEIKQKVGDVLELVGLNREYSSRYPHEFSGGQRQRIGVARALIMNPDFIIADEPISSLDVSIRAQVINLLRELKEEFGLTVLFIAHDLSVVRFFCDRIAVMYNGKIVELASSESLFNNPVHPYTVSLLSAIPQPDPDTEKNRKRIQYDPRQHDYRVDKPTLREIEKNHFVLMNQEEFLVYSNSKKV